MAALAGFFFGPLQLAAQSCPAPNHSCVADFCNKTPATIAPSALWDELEAVSILVDESDEDDFGNGAFERFTSVSAAGNYLFVLGSARK